MIRNRWGKPAGFFMMDSLAITLRPLLHNVEKHARRFLFLFSS
ncbi:hypothetical protein KKH3_35610 [Pectobacterium actinidiae]|nr:hypothetical protein KKH3_35610 [Pectobacterium actinidiae]